MFGFFKSYDQKVQEELQQRARQKKPAPPQRAMTEREAAIAGLQAKVKGVMTPDREELLQNAMKVHRAKQKIFENLADEDRAKLVALAITTLLRGETGEPEPANTRTKKK